MKLTTVYVFPPNEGEHHWDYAARFVSSYAEFPPGTKHENLIVLNGGKPTAAIRCLFSPLPDVRFFERDDSGWDIGAYQHVARETDAELMVCFGGSTFFRRAGWLVRMASAFLKHGNAQYGAMGNRGDVNVGVWPHIRTTAFWFPPGLLNSYPHKINRPELRHPFEHGGNCFTGWVTKLGLKNWVVTWGHESEWKDWDSRPNGYARGNQSECLAFDRMCEFPYFKQR